uniref:BHLH type transcription factor n=1 Tax=Catharanthus roseus TaxID=4058 RepID=A0A8A6M0N9_CATRO|nr:bHLH type transcription factor [Catharanthus roseus]
MYCNFWSSSDQDELFKLIISSSGGRNINNYGSQQQAPNDTVSRQHPPAAVGGPRKKASSTAADESPAAESLRKMIHRDVERQRRQEMAALHQSLRLLIPSQFIQGKRSISDHMDGAVRYIKHMQKKTQDLKNKRDRINKLMNLNFSKAANVASSQTSFDQTNTNIEVTYKVAPRILEINVITVLKGGLPLSRVLNVLVLQGISIKSSISTPIQDKILHIIQIEVNEERNIDQNELQGKLMGLIFNL